MIDFIALVGLFTFLSIIDLVFTIKEIDIKEIIERNPVARWFVKKGPVWISLYKATIVSLVISLSYLTYTFKPTIGKVVLGFGCLLVFLAVSAHLYYLRSLIWKQK